MRLVLKGTLLRLEATVEEDIVDINQMLIYGKTKNRKIFYSEVWLID